MVDENEFNAMYIEELEDREAPDADDQQDPADNSPRISRALVDLETALGEESPEAIKEFVRNAMYKLGYF